MQQDTDTIMEDAVHNATTTREKREPRHQSKVHKYEHRTDRMGKCSDKGGKTVEGMETSYRCRITKDLKKI
jgi:hypothetical protein